MLGKTLKILALSTVLALPASAQDVEAQEEIAGESQPSPFIGRYSGNSFETAMGMIIREDGTFEWGLSVGALDMRAAGTWQQQGDFIVLTSDPKPVAPEFGWSGMENAPDAPLLRVVWASNREPFPYAMVTAKCSNGNVVYEQVLEEGWSPDGEECDSVKSVQLREGIYEVSSGEYDLTGALAPADGQTIRFEFHRNDLGVADFSGMVGGLEKRSAQTERRTLAAGTPQGGGGVKGVCS